MNLSHKLTFSLASLILLLAFAAVPAMAHIDGETGETGHLSTDAAAHTPHPVVKSVTLKGAAADGYIKRGVFMLDFTFEPASTTNEVALPRITTLGTSNELAAMFGNVASPHADGGVSGDLAAGIPADWVVTRITKNSDTSYTAEILASGAAGVFVLGIAQAALAEDTPNTGDAAIGAVYTKPDTDPDEPAVVDGDETNPAKVRINLDITAPLFTNETTEATIDPTAPVVSPILPNRAPLDDKWEHPFDLTFYVRDDMSNIIDFTFEAEPNKVSFSGEGGTGMKMGTGDGEASSTQYGVTVTPRRDVNISDGEEITITIKLSDKADNEGMITAKVKLKKHTATVAPPPGETDRTEPTVTITSAKGTGTDADKVIFTFVFTEAITTTGDNAFTIADISVSNAPTLVASNLATTDNTTFKLKVTPQNDKFPVKVSFKSGAKIGDAANNVLVAAELAKTNTFTPEGVLGVEIDAPAALEFGTLTFTFTFAEEPAEADTDGNLPSGAFTVNDVRASNAEPLVASNLRKLLEEPDADESEEIVYELTVTPKDPTKPVRVQLLARSVSNGGAGTTDDPLLIAGEVDATWSPAVIVDTPPDTIMIPANSYVVVVRDKDAASGIGGLAFRSDVMVREWPDMPDLERLFYTGTAGIILGGGGGGALIVKQAGDATATGYVALAPGTVGISEVMWGIDANFLGNPALNAYAGSQWIELHNLNTTDAEVALSWKTGRAITNDNTITGNLAAPVLDVVTNFFHDRPGNARWEVPGSSGASLTGTDFVSMARKGTFNLGSQDGGQYNKRYTRTGGAVKSRDGRNRDQWEAASTTYISLRTVRTDGDDVLYKYIGTPGRANTASVESQPHIRAGRTGIPTNDVMISEVGNSAKNEYDWIELKGAANKNLRNYMISIVTSNTSDVPLIQFPANDNAKIAANGVFLILKTDPANDPNHPIAANGYNVDLSAEAQQPGTPNSPVRYKVMSSLNLPNDGKFVLILRKPDNHEGQRSGQDGGKGVAETGSADLDKIVDVGGWDDNLARNSYPNAVSSTSVWPLYAFRDIRGFTNNSFAQNTVHQRNRNTTNDGASGIGAQDNNNGKTAFGDRGWTGVGYRRDVDSTLAQHGGTPGYPNGASLGAGDTIRAAVYISEMMYADARNGSLPQWIELRNSSNTVGADLNNWRLTIRNHADAEMHEDNGWDGKVEGSVLLRDLKIKPNGSVLITSRKGPRSDVHLAESEIFNLWPSHKGAFGMKTINSDVINTYGFKITLHANGHEGDRNKWQLVDEVGNLAALDATDRRGNNDRFDMPRWMWPDGKTAAGTRISVARRNALGGTKATGFTLVDGKEESGWILSNMDDRTHLIDNVYYGHMDDMSTPGQTVGQPLPVSLSYFRPTLEDGKVTIRWTTESELDNAGFNILRSEIRNGEFTQVNEQMIQGKGTTAERSNYKWVDTTAKPGAVYYYQIEDVSFAGEHTKLATTKLKGLISAKGKLTTQWGDLKNLR